MDCNISIYLNTIFYGGDLWNYILIWFDFLYFHNGCLHAQYNIIYLFLFIVILICIYRQADG